MYQGTTSVVPSSLQAAFKRNKGIRGFSPGVAASLASVAGDILLVHSASCGYEAKSTAELAKLAP